MNPFLKALSVSVLLLFLAMTVRSAVAQEMTYNIILATDKSVYWFGGSITFHGRAHNLSYGPHDFQLIIDENLGSGYWKNAHFQIFTAYAPEWNFEVKWIPTEPGNYSAYILGPDHTLSNTVSFLVVPMPVPEFPLPAMISFVVLTLLLVTVHGRTHRGYRSCLEE